MKKLYSLLLLSSIILLTGCTTTQPTNGQQGGGDDSQSGGLFDSLGVNIYSENSVGDSAVLFNDLKITVNDVKITRYYTYYASNWDKTLGKLAASGKKFVIFDLDVKNIGESTINVKEDYFTLISDNGNNYDSVTYGGDDALGFGDISAGITNEGKLVFEVPESVSDSALLFDLDELFGESQYNAFIYDSTALTFNENMAGLIDITSVDYTSSSIKYIYYSIENTGNIGFIPIIDYTVSIGSNVVRTSTKENPFDTILLVEESTDEQIAAHIPISTAGTYTIDFELSDKVTGETIDTTSKEVVIS